jgi:hypothetical protein
MRTKYGWVEIDNIRYDHDVIVHTDRRVTKRSKKKSKNLKKQFGHTPLAGHELKFLDKEKPEVIIVGTGQFGDLPITTDALKILTRYDAVINPTSEVIDLLGTQTRPFVAILHVNC